MNEKKRFYVVIGIFILMIILSLLVLIANNNMNKKKLEIFNDYFTSSEEKLIYFYREGCYYCKLLDSARKSVLDENNIDYYYVNTDTIGNSTLDSMLSKLGITEFGTPTLAVVKNGEVIKIQSGVFNDQTDNVAELTEFVNTYNIATLEKSE